MSNLLVISPAPATVTGDGIVLDIKFCEGMKLYADMWDGRVGCLLRDRGEKNPFGRAYDPAELPFDIRVEAPGGRTAAEDLAGYDVILCDGDGADHLSLPPTGGARIVYTIEYVLQTRLQIINLARGRDWLGKLKSALWTLRQETRRRRAFRRADGLQANGYPAYAAYAGLNPRPLLYLDNRVGAALLATEAEMAARTRRLSEGGRLRLLHSGRLEMMKGSQDLVPIARRLAEAGVDFELNIFGAGALEAEIRAGIAAAGLQDLVKLRGSVDFETELVPFARAHADIYLSCHRQSDPSCTYLESMGCGLPVVGYDNLMWRALRDESDAGWVAPLGDHRALAERIIGLARAPEEIAEHAARARAFAGDHAFETEFVRRVAHLQAVAAEARGERG